MYRQLSLFLLFMWLTSCKSPGSNSQVADEGLTRANTRSIADIVERLVKLYNFDAADTKLLEQNLAQIIQSVFKIDSGDASGTAFFVGPNGYFVSAGHVLVEDQKATIKVAVVKNGVVAFGEKEVMIDVYAGEHNAGKGVEDFSYGKVIGYHNATFLNIPRVDPPYSAMPKEKLLNLGFPMETLRNIGLNREEKIILSRANVIQTCNRTLLLKRDIKIDNDDLIKEVKEQPELKASLEKHHQDLMQYTNFDLSFAKAYCAYRKTKNAELLRDEYDNVDDKQDPFGLYLSVGSVYADLGTHLASDHDAFWGFSGGPLVDFRTLTAYGINVLSVMDSKQEIQLQYHGDMAERKISRSLIEKYKKADNRKSPVCWCQVRIFKENDPKATALKTNFLFKVPKETNIPLASYCSTANFPPESAGVLTSEGETLKETFYDCKLAYAHTRSSLPKAGSAWRLYDENGAYLGRQYVDASIASYLIEVYGD